MIKYLYLNHLKRFVRTTAIASFALSAIFTSAKAKEIDEASIANNRFTFTVPYEKMKDSSFMTELLRDSRSVGARVEEGGTAYVTPSNEAFEAAIDLTFDFTKTKYEVVSATVTDSFNFFAQPDSPSETSIEASLSWGEGKKEDLWSIICRSQSRHEDPFQSIVAIGGAKVVTYQVLMKVLAGDTSGQFRDAAYQWNRLGSPDDDETRAFKVVFELRESASPR